MMRGDPVRVTASRDRLQPALLDRLLDDEPGKLTESPDKRVINMDRLRQCVLRDLDALLNHAPLSQAEDLSEFPRVSTSVLNYGFPNLLGAAPRAQELEALQRQLRQVLIQYEPRIEARSLRVDAVNAGPAATPGTIAFRITGTLWGQPLPTRLYLQTLVDLSTGEAVVQETSGEPGPADGGARA